MAPRPRTKPQRSKRVAWPVATMTVLGSSLQTPSLLMPIREEYRIINEPGAVTFVVPGDSFVLKNSKRLINAGGCPRLIPSSAAVGFVERAALAIRVQWSKMFLGPIPEHVMVNAKIVTYLSSRRRADASNLYQAIEDCLGSCKRTCKSGCKKHAGVLVDDYQIASHDGSRRLYDKDRPRVVVTLTAYQDGDKVDLPREKDRKLTQKGRVLYEPKR